MEVDNSMIRIEPEWTWDVHCPECGYNIDQFDEDIIEEEADGDDSKVTCSECGFEFLVKLGN